MSGVPKALALEEKMDEESMQAACMLYRVILQRKFKKMDIKPESEMSLDLLSALNVCEQCFSSKILNSEEIALRLSNLRQASVIVGREDAFWISVASYLKQRPEILAHCEDELRYLVLKEDLLKASSLIFQTLLAHLHNHPLPQSFDFSVEGLIREVVFNKNPVGIAKQLVSLFSAKVMMQKSRLVDVADEKDNRLFYLLDRYLRENLDVVAAVKAQAEIREIKLPAGWYFDWIWPAAPKAAQLGSSMPFRALRATPESTSESTSGSRSGSDVGLDAASSQSVVLE